MGIVSSELSGVLVGIRVSGILYSVFSILGYLA